MSQLFYCAHPGHELLMHDWMCRGSPLVLALTDGSGGERASRADLSRRIIERAGARVAEPFAAHTDAAIYRAILARDVDFFEGLVLTLADLVQACSVEVLISDAAEHYNPVHDLCSVIATLAARRATERGTPVRRLSCAIECEPRAEPAFSWSLSPQAQTAKAQAIRQFESLVEDVNRVIAARGPVLRREALYEVDADGPLLTAPYGPIVYEAYGAVQIRRRGGGRLITFAHHVQPLVAALERRLQPKVA